jgi:regulator of CtrA degradation
MLEKLAGKESEGPVQATAFFGKTYGEAVDLLVEARDYLAHREPIDRETLTPIERLKFCCETMRLTARLTQIMAWLLAQRAVHAGEISQEDALADHRALADLAICMESDDAAAMPRRLGSLLERSQRLYVRVARLDELARRQLT